MITVVVSVYNMGQYLPKAIESLLAQTFRDIEILIVDDGSSEEDAKECDRQAESNDRIRVFHKENGGLSSARNCGIKQAKGEYIIFPDPDDWVERDYLEKLMVPYGEKGTDLSICGHYITKDEKDTLWATGAKKTILDRETALELVMRPDLFCGYAWNKLYRMDLIREHGLLFDEELGMIQDLHFAVRYLMLCNKIVYDPVPLYHYSRDNGGVTLFQRKLGARELSGLRTYEKIAELTEKAYPSVAATSYASLCERALRFVSVYIRTEMDEPEILDFLRRKFKRYRRYFLADRRFTKKHKLSGMFAAYSPRFYYFLVRTFGHGRKKR